MTQKGKGYKDGIITVQAPDNNVIAGVLDWSKATSFDNQGTDYLSIPFMFTDYGIKIPGDAARQIPAVSFKIVIRRQGDTLSGALQTTTYGNTMENIETGRSSEANIQTYTGFDNKLINTWKQEATRIKPTYRSYLSQVEIAAIRKAAKDRKADYAKAAKANVVNGRPVTTASAAVQECGWVTTYEYVNDPDCSQEETVTSTIDDGATLPTVVVCSKRISKVTYVECPIHTPPSSSSDQDDGGYPAQLPDDNPQPEDPCAKALRAAKVADSIFNESTVMGRFAELTNIDSIEKGFIILSRLKYVGTSTSGGHKEFDGYETSEVQTGTKDKINYHYEYNANINTLVSFVHTHPLDGPSPPSAVDISELMSSVLERPRDYIGNFVVAAGGETYFMAVTDTTAAKNMDSIVNMSIDPNTRSWKEKSDIGKAFRDAQDHYRKRFNDKNTVYAMSMSAVLSQFKTGVVLMKKDASGHFKPIMQNVVETQGKRGRIKKQYVDSGC